MTRRKLVAGNWKMNGSLAANRALAAEILERLPARTPCDIVVCPPSVHLAAVAEALQGQSRLQLGAQDVAGELEGAHTGDVSAGMLAELGVRYCIVGHSERRQHRHEGNQAVAQKTLRALDSGLTPIVCVGETAQQRDAGWADWVTGHQLYAVTRALGQRLADVVLAYEPVWAIGTGKVASAADAQEVCAAIRGLVRELAGDEVADGIRILYGGSVKTDSVAEIVGQPDVDGGLVGGASLDGEEFAKLAAAAASVV